LQIRDIAGLQAAQLIHANKEYQKAIEVISEKFLQVGNEMTVISDMCHKFMITGNSASQSHFIDIIDRIERTAYFIDVYGKSLNLLKDRYYKSKNKLSEILYSYFELSDFVSTIERNILKSIDNQNIPEDESNTINQIKQILGDMRANLAQHEALFEKIKVEFSLADNAVEKYYKNESVATHLSEFSNLSENIISFLKDSNQIVYRTIEENQILSRQVSNDIKSSLEQIKYYDFFDKTIEEIISQLNEINFKLQNLESPDEEHKKINLEHLKAKYTMQSEHVIHETISNDKNLTQTDLVSIDSTGIDEDDDNLELF
jgi:antitoxin component HigA of HigAB toxin-antitoxin module